MRYVTHRQRIVGAVHSSREAASWMLGLALLGATAWYVVFDHHLIDPIYLYGLICLFVTMKVLHYFDRRLNEIECKLDLLRPSD